MIRKIVFITLSMLVLVFGLSYWWNSFGRWIYYSGDLGAQIVMISILVFITLGLFSFMFFSFSGLRPSGSKSSSFLVITAFVFASLAALLNLYQMVGFVIPHQQDFPNWVYPIITSLLFSLFYLLPISLTLGKREKRLKKAWLILLISFVLAEIVGFIFPNRI